MPPYITATGYVAKGGRCQKTTRMEEK